MSITGHSEGWRCQPRGQYRRPRWLQRQRCLSGIIKGRWENRRWSNTAGRPSVDRNQWSPTSFLLITWDVLKYQWVLLRFTHHFGSTHHLWTRLGAAAANPPEVHRVACFDAPRTSSSGQSQEPRIHPPVDSPGKAARSSLPWKLRVFPKITRAKRQLWVSLMSSTRWLKNTGPLRDPALAVLFWARPRSHEITSYITAFNTNSNPKAWHYPPITSHVSGLFPWMIILNGVDWAKDLTLSELRSQGW